MLVVLLAARSPAYAVALSALPGIAVGYMGSNPFPRGTIALFSLGWIGLAIVVAVVRGVDVIPLRMLVTAPVLLSLGLAIWMLVRLGASGDTSYGSFKLQLFIGVNLPLLFGGMLIGRRTRDFELWLLLTLLTSTLSAIVIARGLASGTEQASVGGRFAISEQSGPIGLGRSAATGLLLATYVVVAWRAAWPRVAALAVAPLIAVAFLAAGSRGPMLGLVAGMLVLLVLVLRQPERRRRVLLVGLGIVAIALLVPQLVPGQNVSRALSVLTGGEGGLSSNGRFQLWQEAWSSFTSHPLTGLGTGGFATIEPNELYPHNILLEAGAELGVPGVLAIVGIVGGAVPYLVRTWRRLPLERAQGAITASLLTAGFVYAFFSSDIGNNDFVWLAVGLTLGLGSRVAEPLAVAAPLRVIRRHRRLPRPHVRPPAARPRGLTRPIPSAAARARLPQLEPSPGAVLAPAPGAAVSGTVLVTAIPPHGGWGAASAVVQFAGAADWVDLATARDDAFEVGVAEEGRLRRLAIVASPRLAELVRRAAESELGEGRLELHASRRRAGEGGLYSAIWDTTSLSDGAYRLRTLGRDLDGQVLATEPVEVLVDNAPPVVVLDAPRTEGDELVVQPAVSDATTGVAAVVVEVSLGGGWHPLTRLESPPFELRVPADAVPPRGVSLRVRALDRAGNDAASEPVQLFGAPVEPAARERVWSGVVELGPEVELAPAGTDAWRAISHVLDTTVLRDGDYALRSREGDEPVAVVVDNTPPAATLLRPEDGEVVGGEVAVSALVADSGSGIARVQFQHSADGSVWRTIPAAAADAASTVWNAFEVDQGEHLLRVIATDRAGNTHASWPVRVRIANDRAAERATAGPLRVGELARQAEATDDPRLRERRLALVAELRDRADARGELPEHFRGLVGRLF